MPTWPDRRILDLLKIEHPIIQAPMAGSDSVALATAVSAAGGLGSLACALLTPAKIRETVASCPHPINLNFFCHKPVTPTAAQLERWKNRLRPHYERLGLDINHVPESPLRAPFDADYCAVVEEVHPEIVSFHFGLPDPSLVARLKQRGITILSSATSVQEAKWLEQNGCDAIIAQGSEAGGHRAMFLEESVATQTGLFSLIPQIVDAVSVPVIAAGGIADARGIAAALALGASAVQLGTAYLLCPESNATVQQRKILSEAKETAITNLYSGRPARGVVTRFMQESGPMSDAVVPFPHAATLVAPLRAASPDYAQVWAGQSVALAKPIPAYDLTKSLAEEALSHLR
ncbi:MAG: nitronate monooxygenase family protein [Bryobacteraceae bacterium]